MSLFQSKPGPGWLSQGLFWYNPATGERRKKDSNPLGGKDPDELVSELGEPNASGARGALGGAILDTGKRVGQNIAAGVADVPPFAGRAGEFLRDINPATHIGEGIVGAIAGKDFVERGRQNVSQQIGRAEQYADKLAPAPATNRIQQVAEGALRSLPTTLGQGALFAANPVLGTASLVAGESGRAATTARDIGATPTQSLAIGAGVGAISGALERVGLKGLLGQYAKAAGPAGQAKVRSQLFSILGIEPGTEAAQEAVGALGEVAAGRTPSEVAEELPGRLSGAAGAALFTGPLVAGVGGRVQSAIATPDVVPELHEADILGKEFSRKYEGDPKPGILNENILDRFYHEFINSEHAPVGLVKKTIGKDEATQVDQLLQRNRGSSTIAESPVFNRTTRLTPEGNIERTGEGLADIFHGLSDEQRTDIRRLMKAERQLELFDRGDVKLSTEAINDANRLIPAIKDKYSGLGSLGIDDVTQRVRDWSVRSIVDPLVEIGYLSQESRDNILSKNDKYIPFWRLAEEFGDAGPVGSPDEILSKGSRGPSIREIKKDLAGGRTSVNTFEDMISKVQSISRFVERQRVRNKLAEFADEDSPNFSEAFGEEVFEVPMKFVNGVMQAEEGTFSVWQDGKQRTFHAPHDVIRSLDGLAPKDTSIIFEAIKKPAQVLRAGATLSAEFMSRNVFRDQTTAGIYSKYGYVPFWDAAQGFTEILGIGGRGQVFEDFLDSGAAHAVFVAMDQKNPKAIMEDVIRSKGEQDLLGRFKSKVRRDIRDVSDNKLLRTLAAPLRGGLTVLQEVSGTLEMATRVGAFRKAKKKGATDLEAMAEAREITLDFGRAGNTGRTLNAVSVFFNAEVQDVDKFARAVKASPAKTLTKAFAYITLPSIANWVANAGDEDYENLEDWEKVAFYHVKRGNGGFWRIPRSLGVMNTVFGYSVERFLDWSITKEPGTKDRIKNALDETTALGLLPTDLSTEGLTKTASRLAPSALVPPFEVQSNQNLDFQKGKPVEPEGIRANRVPSQRFTEYTPAIYRELGERTGSSPLQLKHLTENYGASVGKMLATGASAGVEAAGLQDPAARYPQDWTDLPGIRGWKTRRPVGASSRPVRMFYDFAKQVRQEVGTAKVAVAEGESIDQFKLVKYSNLVKSTQSKLTELRKKRNKLSAVNKWDQVELIDAQMTKVARVAMENAGKLVDPKSKREAMNQFLKLKKGKWGNE